VKVEVDRDVRVEDEDEALLVQTMMMRRWWKNRKKRRNWIRIGLKFCH